MLVILTTVSRILNYAKKQLTTIRKSTGYGQEKRHYYISVTNPWLILHRICVSENSAVMLSYILHTQLEIEISTSIP